MREKTKDLIKGIIISILFIVFMMTLSNGVDNSTYTLEATVVYTDNNYVVAEDTTGNQWAFYNEYTHEGQRVEMLMDNRCTQDIKDDCIVNVKVLAAV